MKILGSVSVPLRGVRRETFGKICVHPWFRHVSVPLRGVRRETLVSIVHTTICLRVSVPLRGVRRETPHIFEDYTVKLLIGSISIGHLHSQ